MLRARNQPQPTGVTHCVTHQCDDFRRVTFHCGLLYALLNVQISRGRYYLLSPSRWCQPRGCGPASSGVSGVAIMGAPRGSRRGGRGAMILYICKSRLRSQQKLAKMVATLHGYVSEIQGLTYPFSLSDQLRVAAPALENGGHRATSARSARIAAAPTTRRPLAGGSAARKHDTSR